MATITRRMYHHKSYFMQQSKQGNKLVTRVLWQMSYHWPRNQEKCPQKNTNGGPGPKKKSINLFPCVEKTQAKLFCPLVSLHKVHQCTESFCIFFSPCLRLSPNVAPPWDSLCFLSFRGTAVFLLNNNQTTTKESLLLLFLSHSRTSFVQITLLSTPCE